ncbi:MAG: hypothetical protein JW924_03775 [Fusobacteriaceae bacterium]|nr:hypothetical protein [Fusobacteriaceae bacterium]
MKKLLLIIGMIMLTSLMYSNEIVDKNEQYILRNYEGGEYKKVIKEAKKILKQNKDSFVANKYLGLCYSHNKKYNKANLYLKKAQSLDNKDRDIEKELIYCMQDTQKIEKAEAYAKKYKKDADSMEFLARVYYSYGDKEKGLTLLEESLKKYPKEPSLYNLKGLICFVTYDLKGAEDNFTKAIELKSVSIYYKNRGIVRKMLKNQKGMDEDFAIYSKLIED